MNKNKFFVSCLASVVSCVFTLSVQAGTTHSLGGHSMVNARNYSASREFGGRNVGGHFAGFSRAHSYLQKTIADFKARHSGSNLKSFNPSNYSVTHSIQRASHSTSIVNTLNGNSIQHSGTNNHDSYGRQQHTRSSTVSMNGRTYDTEKTTTKGLVENQSTATHQSTTRFANDSGDAVFRGRNTSVFETETQSISQLSRTTYTQVRSKTGEGKYHSKTTIITPGTDSPIQHYSVSQ